MTAPSTGADPVTAALLATTELRVGAATGIPADGMDRLAAGLASAVRALIAEAVQAERERIAAAIREASTPSLIPGSSTARYVSMRDVYCIARDGGR